MDLGHEWVDLLKIDIETSEWELFSDFYAIEGTSLPATQVTSKSNVLILQPQLEVFVMCSVKYRMIYRICSAYLPQTPLQ